MRQKHFLAAATVVCAAVLTGCDWGGVGSEESWNDSFAWANFTGNYKLVVPVTSVDAESAVPIHNVSRRINWDFDKNGGVVSVGQKDLVPGTVSLSVSGPTSISYSDNGQGKLVASPKSYGEATVSYTTGAINIDTANINPGAHTLSFIFGFYGNAVTGASGGEITWINLTQKGHVLTMKDNKGVVYNGKITAASCPRADESGNTPSGNIRFTFEAVAASNPKLTLSGSLSGYWNTATSDLTDRVIDASYHNGSSTTQFQAAGGTVTIYDKPVVPGTGSTD